MNSEVVAILGEARKIRDELKQNHDCIENPIDTSFDPIPPYKGAGEIKLIVIGQDPTIRNKNSRKKIKYTLNLDKGNCLSSYIANICNLENVYATNVFKYFYADPPADTKEVLEKHLEKNLNLLKKEISYFGNIPVITLGEPVLELLSTGEKKVRNYWGYDDKRYKYCTKENSRIDRKFYPFPHQPSLRKRYYKDNLIPYITFFRKNE